MDVKNTQSLNSQQTNLNTQNPKSSSKAQDSDINFADELKNCEKSDIKSEDSKVINGDNTDKDTCIKKEEEQQQNLPNKENSENIDNAIDGLKDVFEELNKITQKDDIKECTIKSEKNFADIKEYKSNNDNREDIGLIDNNMNIQEMQDKINLQMEGNTNFNNNGQPFSEFVNTKNNKEALKSSAEDLAEEQAILSTMEENIAIANKNMAMSKTKTVENEHGIYKTDKKSNLIVDTIVSYDKVVMDKSDVEFFANLVENGVINMNEVTSAEKSSRVSKALADLLAKSMNENKPVRIDFDNDISVIIKIDRAGKISADFLPSSQVAEAYLKENLPLLRQRFDDNNIDYNELNQRQRKQDTQDNRKKERKNE